MTQNRYAPNERIVDRAVELWKRVLAQPRYHLGPLCGLEARGAAKECRMAALAPKNNTPAVLNAFGAALKRRLMEVALRADDGRDYYERHLSVDYGPCPALVEAAAEAGLRMAFPFKTTMVLNRGWLFFSCGYGEPVVYHYPIAGGDWLVTQLHGADIDKVLAYVQGGKPAFFVEPGRA